MSFNPLQGRLGATVTVNLPELLTSNFRIREICYGYFDDGAGQAAFTDYVLSRQSPEPGTESLRLRAVPRGPHFDLLLLRLFDDIPFNEDFWGVVTDTTGKLEVTDNSGMVEYLRVGGRTDSLHGHVTVEQMRDGSAYSAPVREEWELEAWDYMRETIDRAGQRSTSYLFVELDRAHARFSLWQGTALNPQRVFIN